MAENRKPRRFLVEGMGVYAKTMFNTAVEVLELSVSGAMIRGARGLLIGCKYTFKLEHAGRIIPVDGVVEWEQTSMEKNEGGEAIPVYTAGIEFMDLRADKAELLKELIKDKTRELRDRRLSAVRVSISPPGKAMLSFMETCEIKDISTGGMRILTGQKPPHDAVFSLELILDRTAPPIRCSGRIAFCNEVSEMMSSGYHAGVEFREMTDGDKSVLETFVNSLS